jgi:hypothetical protein
MPLTGKTLISCTKFGQQPLARCLLGLLIGQGSLSKALGFLHENFVCELRSSAKL